MSKRLALFDKLISEGSQDPFHHYGRAMELRSLSRKDEALQAFEAVIARFADYVPSYLMAAQVASELGHVERARALGRAGLRAAERAGDEHALSELNSFVDGLNS
jgi:hypothetical protein